MYTSKVLSEASIIGGDVVQLKPAKAYSEYGPSSAYHDITVPGFADYVETRREKILSDDSRPHTKWKDCEHYKLYFDPNDVGTELFPWFSTNGVSDHTFVGDAKTKSLVALFPGYIEPSLALYPLIQERPDGGFVSPPPDLDWLITSSMRAMTPSIKSELSTLNSLYELKDFVSLKGTLKNIANLVLKPSGVLSNTAKLKPGLRKILNSFVPKGRKVNRVPTLREILDATADGYLQYRFNISPLLSDITGIYNAVVNAEKRLRELINRSGKRQRRHFTYRWDPFNYDRINTITEQIIHSFDTARTFNGVDDVYRGGILSSILRTWYSGNLAIFHAEMEFNYSFNSFQAEHARLLSLLDRLGINLNPAIIWNAIPWTFVVDWLLDVSSWLNDRRVLNLQPLVNISRYLWSWQYLRTKHRSFNSYASWPDAKPILPVNLPHVYESVYRRQVGRPTKDPVFLGSLSPTEVTIGAALVISRAPRRYSRLR
jgi:hypothetical protein